VLYFPTRQYLFSRTGHRDNDEVNGGKGGRNLEKGPYKVVYEEMLRY
jgi:hypothetical protein